MRRLLGIVGLVAGTGLLAASPTFGQESEPLADTPFHITADSVEYESERDIYVARGNVRITQPDRSLSSDWASFSNVTRQGVATGNVVVVEGGDTLYADFLHFQVDSLEGVVYEGRLDGRDSEFLMQGKEIHKTGDQTYTFQDATFTTCRCPPGEEEPWKIRAETADLEIGGYGTARNSTLEVLGVPVLWLPWMIYPLKGERQTGFLFPEINASARSGGDVGIPFFWAARDDVNVILTNSYLFKRGYKPSLEVEYVFGEQSWSEAYATWINDKDIDSDDADTPFSRRRWGVDWLHDHELPWDLRWKVDATVLSDNQFSRDFKEFNRERRKRFVESKSFVGRDFGKTGRYGGEASVFYADDIQNPDDQDRDDWLLHRLPDVRFAGLPAAWRKHVVPSFDVRYTHFTARDDAEDVWPAATNVDDVFLDTGIDSIPNGDERNDRGDIVRLDGTVELEEGGTLTAAEYMATLPPPTPGSTVFGLDGSQDDFPPGVEGDRRFQEGEPLVDRGHRVVLNPRVAFPFRWADAVEIYPELGYYGTFYETEQQSLEQRHLLTARLDLRSRLQRRVQMPWGFPQVLHVMEPRFEYAVVSSASQRDHPLFIPRAAVPNRRLRQFDLDNVTRDPADRIESFNGFTVGLGNRFYEPGLEGLPPSLWGELNFSTQYEWAGSTPGNFFVEGLFYPSDRLTTDLILGWDLDEGRVSEGLLGFNYATPEGFDLRVEYRYVRDIPRFFENFRFDSDRFDEFEEGFVRVNQFRFFGRVPLNVNWALTYQARYSFERSFFLTNQGGVEYVSRCKCWALRVELGHDRSDGFEFQFQYQILGLGDDTVRPFSGNRTRREDRGA